MSEQPVLVREHYRGGGAAPDAGGPPPGNGAPAPDQGGGGGGGFMSARWGPLPVWGWAALAGVLAVGAFFWIRRGQQGAAQSQAAAANTSSTAGTATDTGCYDSGGNSVPCAQADYAGQIASLQSEIDNMQGTGSTPVSTPGAGSTTQVTVPDVTGDSVVQARATLQMAGLTAIVQGGSRGRGTVTAQSPSSGTMATVGDSVTLTATGSSSNGSGTNNRAIT